VSVRGRSGPQEHTVLTTARTESASLQAARARKGLPRTAVTSALLLLSLLLGLSSPVAAASSSPLQVRPVSSANSITSFTLADFDGDSKPDLASVEFRRFESSVVRYSITFRLSAGNRQTVEVTAPFGGLDVAAFDVNGDLSLDLIVRTAGEHRLVAVLLNDGHGHFAEDPSALLRAAGESPTAFFPVVDRGFEDSALSRPGDSASQFEGNTRLPAWQESGHLVSSPGPRILRFCSSSSLGRSPPSPLLA